MSKLLEHIEIEPNQKAHASVIWLHGLGADGHEVCLEEVNEISAFFQEVL